MFSSRPGRGGPLRHRRSAGFGAVGLVAVLVVLAVIGFVAWQVVQSKRNSTATHGKGQLVGLPPAKEDDRKDDGPAKSPDGLPDGFVAYTDAKLGFSFAYPEAWGGLKPVPDPATVLNLSTDKVVGYSLADSLQVSVTKTSTFRMRANDKGVIVTPALAGDRYDWIVIDKGTDKVPTKRPLAPAPPVIYRSGKAQVYNFLASNGACTYNMWAFPVRDNFVKLRLPSFCVSPKPGDAEVQTQHKNEFDSIKSQILQSITVL